MAKEKLHGAEITVRVSLTFQEAPDIHTLFAMTPVRQRAKLIREALTMYIIRTNHPAGQVEIQIDAISNWLKSRQSDHSTAIPTELTDAEQTRKQSAYVQGSITLPSAPSRDPCTALSSDKSSASPADVKPGHPIEESSTMNRWLNE